MNKNKSEVPVFRQGTQIARILRITRDLFLMGERIDETSVVIFFSKNLRVFAKSALSAFNLLRNLSRYKMRKDKLQIRLMQVS
jgi:hypothetical protein